MRNFLRDDLIDEIIITELPILLGSGVPLFGELDEHMKLELVSSATVIGQAVKRHYKRKSTH